MIKIGDRFGNLRVVELSGQNKTQQNLWKCICVCGKNTIISSSNVKRTKSCGCSKHKKPPNWKGYGKVTGTYISALKHGAKKRGIDYDPKVTAQYLYEIFLQQNQKCAITGTQLDLTNNASVDRIDSRKGYIPGNIWWVTKNINKMKLDFTLDHFIQLCEMVTANKENIKNGR